MQRPMFPSIAPGDFSAIINLALHELGLNENFLLRAFVAAKGRPKFKDGEWDIGAVDVTEWIWICKKLYLSVDCVSTGYFRMSHRHWVGQAILEGAYVLPMTDQARRLFREYLGIQRYEIRSQKSYYGPELRLKVAKGRREEAKLRRIMRRKNLKTAVPARRKNMRLFTQSAIRAVMIEPERRSSNRDEAGLNPGLAVHVGMPKQDSNSETTKN